MNRQLNGTRPLIRQQRIFQKLKTAFVLAMCLCAGWTTAQAAAPVVSNVRASQRLGTEFVDIYYDLFDADSPTLTVSVAVSTDGGSNFTLPATGFSGDGYGTSVTPGNNKHVEWNAGMDLAPSYVPNVMVRITADDIIGPFPMATGRAYHTATLLGNGKVLVAGGYNYSGSSFVTIASAEVYDPATGTWTATGALTVEREGHTATLLPNGNVLVAGGMNSRGWLPRGELYDPASGTWTATAGMGMGREDHTATLLSNGKVLVAGGRGYAGRLSSAVLYDPASGTWTATGELTVEREGPTATLLPNEKVLVAGGVNNSAGWPSRAELYDPVSGTWTATGAMNKPRWYHTATLLPNGKVLVTGGGGLGPEYVPELYDPAGGTWTATCVNTQRFLHTATLLPNGKVLVAGGAQIDSSQIVGSAELYDPATGTWTATGAMATAREYHTATLLPNGKVLATGGFGSGPVSLASVEVYDPVTGMWTARGLVGTSAEVSPVFAMNLLCNGNGLAISGHVSYRDYDGVTRDAAYVHVQVWEKQTVPFTDVLVANGYTDGQGDFTFTHDVGGQPICNEDTAFGESGTRDVFLVIRAENDATSVHPALLTDTYTYTSSTWWDVTGPMCSLTSFLTTTASTPGHASAFGMPGMIYSAREWLRTRTGWQRASINIYYPYILALLPGYVNWQVEWAWYLGSFDSIFVEDRGNLIDSSTFAHEYGHAVHHSARGGSLPSGSGPNPHFNYSVSSEGFALTEGWADFFSAAVNSPFPLAPGAPGAALERNDYWMGPNSRHNPEHFGNVVEGAVASVFWELYDGIGDDGVDSQFAGIWSIVTNSATTSIWNTGNPTASFYHQWNTRFGRSREVDEIFIDEGMPVLDDGCESNNFSFEAFTIADCTYTNFPDLILADDADWFTFHLGERPSSGSFVGLTNDPSRSYLKLALLDGALNVLRDTPNFDMMNGEVTFDLTGLYPGNYYLRVMGFNADFSPYYSLALTRLPDESSPVFEVTNYADGEVVASSQVTLRGWATDAGHGGNGIYPIYVNGQRAFNDVAALDGYAYWSANVSLSPGTNQISIVVSDDSNQHNAASTTLPLVYVPPDTTPPSLAVTSHTDGQTVYSGTVTLDGTASDSGRGNHGIASVTVNGIRADNDTATGSGVASWSRLVTLVAGGNQFEVVATDNSVNQNTVSQTISLVYVPDTTAPALSITGHSDGETVSTSTITLAGSASDAGRGDNGVVWVKVNGTRASNDTVAGSGTANWSRVLSLTSGTNWLTVTAADNEANQTSQPLSLVYLPSVAVEVGFGSPIPLTPAGFELRLKGPTGFTYRIDASTNLSTWDPITNLFLPVSPTLLRDPDATNFEQRFYRAMMP